MGRRGSGKGGVSRLASYAQLQKEHDREEWDRTRPEVDVDDVDLPIRVPSVPGKTKERKAMPRKPLTPEETVSRKAEINRKRRERYKNDPGYKKRVLGYGDQHRSKKRGGRPSQRAKASPPGSGGSPQRVRKPANRPLEDAIQELEQRKQAKMEAIRKIDVALEVLRGIK